MFNNLCMRHLAVVVLLSLTGCYSGLTTSTGESGSTPTNPSNPSPIVTTPTSTTFIYRVGQSSDKIYRASVNSNDGSLSELPATDLTTGDAPSFAAVSPDKKYLFVTKYGSKTVDTYSLDQTTGEPTFIYSYATTNPPLKVRVEPQGRFLYVVEYDRVENYIIAANGSLTWFGGVGVGYDGKDVAFDATGTKIYIVATGTGLRSFDISATNGTMSNGSNSTGISLNAIKVDSTNNRLYGPYYSDNKILNFTIDPSTGLFTFVNMYTADSTIFPNYDLALNAAGTRAYMVNNYLGLVQSYSVNTTTGIFTLLNTVSLPSGCQPRSLEMLSTENFLYTGCTDTSGKTFVTKIESDGSISSASSTVRTDLTVQSVLSVTF